MVADPLEAIRRLLSQGHQARPEDLPLALTDVAPLLDATEITVLLADYGQIALRPLRGPDRNPASERALPIDGTVPGRTFSTGRVLQAGDNDDVQMFLPLLNGAERLGVLQVRAKAEPDDQLRRDLATVAALVAELVASRRHYGDAIENTRRRYPMQIAAEIIWNQLPPLTFATTDAVVTAVLEPCYDVGGDAFDYAINGDVLHVALFDTVGHGISASALTTLTLNTYRNARRCGLPLTDTYRSIDKWIGAQYPGAFVTAILAELDGTTGVYRRICAGHPAELLLRDRKAIRDLPTPTAMPLGLGYLRDRPPIVTEDALQPGDTMLLFTDGVIEARSAEGELFGRDRLADFVSKALADRLPAAETMRRLIHAILAHQHEELQDDATAALLQWRPGHAVAEPTVAADRQH